MEQEKNDGIHKINIFWDPETFFKEKKLWDPYFFWDP